MKSETAEKHKHESSNDLNIGIITLSDSIKSKKLDLSGKIISDKIKSKYCLKVKRLIPDDREILIKTIEDMINEHVDVIITTGGTGLTSRDITVETVEALFNKKIEGFGELFRMKSFEEIGSSSILSRATAGTYKKTLIFSIPGSPNAVELAVELIINELPHFVHHVKK